MTKPLVSLNRQDQEMEVSSQMMSFPSDFLEDEDSMFELSNQPTPIMTCGIDVHRIQAGSSGKERPGLQLALCTKPIEPVPPPAEAVAASSIFGGAKPIDLAAREREMEERLAREKDVVKDPKEKEPEARVRSMHPSDSGSGFVRDVEDAIPQYKIPIPKQLERDTQPYTLVNAIDLTSQCLAPVGQLPTINRLPRTRQRCGSNSSTESDSNLNSKSNHPATDNQVKVKRPLSSFIIFTTENRKTLADQFPHLKNKEITSLLGKYWNDIGTEAHEYYKKKSLNMEEIRKKEHPGFAFNPAKARIAKLEKMKSKELKDQNTNLFKKTAIPECQIAHDPEEKPSNSHSNVNNDKEMDRKPNRERSVSERESSRPCDSEWSRENRTEKKNEYDADWNFERSDGFERERHENYPPPRTPGLFSSSVADVNKMWHQSRRKQHTEEITMTVERARQRRTEEGKHYKQMQCAQEKAKTFEKSDKEKDSKLEDIDKSRHSSDYKPPSRDGKERDRNRDRSQPNYQCYNFSRQFQKNLSPRFQKHAAEYVTQQTQQPMLDAWAYPAHVMHSLTVECPGSGSLSTTVDNFPSYPPYDNQMSDCRNEYQYASRFPHGWNSGFCHRKGNQDYNQQLETALDSNIRPESILYNQPQPHDFDYRYLHLKQTDTKVYCSCTADEMKRSVVSDGKQPSTEECEAADFSLNSQSLINVESPACEFSEVFNVTELPPGNNEPQILLNEV